MPAATANFALSKEEVIFFEENGYLGPYATFTPEEMVEITRGVNEVLADKSPWASHNGQSRHLDKKVIWDLCSHPAIVERMASVSGPDLVLWRSNFFTKQPGDKEIPWHQDHNYWPLNPKINITAWVAIDNVTVENSCVQILPGRREAIRAATCSGPSRPASTRRSARLYWGSLWLSSLSMAGRSPSRGLFPPPAHRSSITSRGASSQTRRPLRAITRPFPAWERMARASRRERICLIPAV